MASSELTTENFTGFPSFIKQLNEQGFEKVNPALNAVTYTRKDHVYEEAKQLKERPFKGVPTALKDISQTIQGQLSTGGARLMKDMLAPATANFTKQLLNSGVLSIGNSTTPKFALKNITESK